MELFAPSLESFRLWVDQYCLDENIIVEKLSDKRDSSLETGTATLCVSMMNPFPMRTRRCLHCRCRTVPPSVLRLNRFCLRGKKAFCCLLLYYSHNLNNVSKQYEVNAKKIHGKGRQKRGDNSKGFLIFSGFRGRTTKSWKFVRKMLKQGMVVTWVTWFRQCLE